MRYDAVKKIPPIQTPNEHWALPTPVKHHKWRNQIDSQNIQENIWICIFHVICKLFLHRARRYGQNINTIYFFISVNIDNYHDKFQIFISFKFKGRF